MIGRFISPTYRGQLLGRLAASHRRSSKTAGQTSCTPRPVHSSFHAPSDGSRSTARTARTARPVDGLVLLERLQIVEPSQEEQVGDLLDDFERVGDPAGPEGVPDAIDLAAQLAGQHVGIPQRSAGRGTGQLAGTHSSQNEIAAGAIRRSAARVFEPCHDADVVVDRASRSTSALIVAAAIAGRRRMRAGPLLG
jgi:hypothetical protein